MYSTLTQLLACFGKYLCMLSVGLIANFPVLAIPMITSGELNIKMSAEEISWMVSIIYLGMPIGSTVAAIPIKIYRKKPMIMANLIMLGGWLLTMFGHLPWHLILARGIGGFGMTISQPHVNAYIGEVAEPRLRGILGSMTQTLAIVGTMIISALTYLHNWEMSIIICSTVTVITIIYIIMIPESPVLLVERRKYPEAMKNLKKLRGWKWADEEKLNKEFLEILQYCHPSAFKKENCWNDFLKEAITNDNTHAPNTMSSFEDVPLPGVINFGFEQDKFDSLPKKDPPHLGTARTSNNGLDTNNLKLNRFVNSIENKSTDTKEMPMYRFICEPEMRKPLILMLVVTFFTVGPSTGTILIYLEMFVKNYELTIQYSTLTTIVTVSMLLGNITSICTVKALGRKRITMITTICGGLGYAGLALLHLFKDELNTWSPIIMYCLLVWLFFMEEFGLKTLYYALCSEVFPMRGKLFGPMIIVWSICIIGITVSYTVPKIIANYGAMFLVLCISIFNFLGSIFFYNYMFETEGRTLAEVECIFRNGK